MIDKENSPFYAACVFVSSFAIVMTTFDFEADLKNQLQTLAGQAGIKLPSNRNIREALIDYLTFQGKLIEPRSRRVLISPELLDELPRNPRRSVINHIAAMASRGDNINCFQSKKVLQTNFHDHLLNEWGVHHFHLSLQKDKGGLFVKQTNALLFVYVDDEHFTLLGVDTHRDGVFGDIKWLEILHDRFPHLIEQFKDAEVRDVVPKLTATERQRVWDVGFTLGMTRVRDTVYHSPGVGRILSGHRFSILSNTNSILRWLHAMATQFKVYAKDICRGYGLDPNNLVATLIVVDGKLHIVDKVTSSTLISFPDIFTFQASEAV